MKNGLFSIGQLSRIKRITIKALRFYEKTGVINPCYIDPATKYRYYSIEQFIQFDVIKAMRTIGISPKDIREILEKEDTRLLLEYLDNQKENALQKIATLQKNIRMIDLARDTMRESFSKMSSEDIVTRELSKRYIVSMDINAPFDENEILVNFSEFPKMIEEHKLLDMYTSGIALLPGENNEFHPKYVFQIVEPAKYSNRKVLSTLPAGEYVCVSYNRRTIAVQQQKLNDYLGKKKLNPKLMLQIDLLNDVFVPANQYFELQALV